MQKATHDLTSFSSQFPVSDENKFVLAEKRYILDNDGSNIFCHSDPLDDEVIDHAVQECPDTVTTYLICPNWCGKFFFSTQVGEILPESCAQSFHALINSGKDPLGMFIERMRSTGRETFITYRTNDVHGADDPNHPGASEFKKAHPDFVVDPADTSGNWMSRCLDYSRPEVREYYLNSLTEMAERYDVDGFQIDWMRFPRHLSGNNTEEVWAKRSALTEFMASVREMLDKVGIKRGSRILLSARVPTWLEGCRKVGIDVSEWNRLKLLDFISIAPFLSCDFSMPIADFRELLGEPSIPIYAGTDLNHSGRVHTPETYRAWSLNMYDQGADGLNIFNFPCWTEYLAARPYHWIADLDNPKKLVGKSALYTLINSYHRVPEVDQPTQIPTKLTAEELVQLKLWLPKLALPAARAMVLVHSGGNLDLTINGQIVAPRRLPLASDIFPPYLDEEAIKRQPKKENCGIFDINPQLLQVGANEISLTNQSGLEQTIDRFDLGLFYE